MTKQYPGTTLCIQCPIVDCWLFYRPLCSVDLGLLLPKTGGVEAELGGMEPPAAEGLGGQSLVFTNSHHNGTRTATHSYASAAANSYAPAALVRQPAERMPVTWLHAFIFFLMLIHTYTLVLCSQVNLDTWKCFQTLSTLPPPPPTVLSPGLWFWGSEWAQAGPG